MVKVGFNLEFQVGGYTSIVIPDELGGRNILSQTFFEEKQGKDGNLHSNEQMFMDGIAVFSFAISTVTKSIKDLLDFSSNEADKIDDYLLHQANRMILLTVAKKMKVLFEKFPVNIDRFGNTNSATIPLLLSSENGNSELIKKVLTCGFGAGLSWGTAILDLRNTKVSCLCEI